MPVPPVRLGRPTHNPGAASRAAQALLADPARGNLAIAATARCSAWTVMSARRALERLGQIPPHAARPGVRPGQQLPSRTRDAIAAGASTPRQVADAAGTSVQAAWKALKLARSRPAPPLPGRACGPVPTRGDPVFPVGWPTDSPAAVRVCTRYCPALAACRAWALTQPARPGVLGGLTQAERNRRGGGPPA